MIDEPDPCLDVTRGGGRGGKVYDDAGGEKETVVVGDGERLWP